MQENGQNPAMDNCSINLNSIFKNHANGGSSTAQSSPTDSSEPFSDVSLEDLQCMQQNTSRTTIRRSGSRPTKSYHESPETKQKAKRVTKAKGKKKYALAKTSGRSSRFRDFSPESKQSILKQAKAKGLPNGFNVVHDMKFKRKQWISREGKMFSSLANAKKSVVSRCGLQSLGSLQTKKLPLSSNATVCSSSSPETPTELAGTEAMPPVQAARRKVTH